MMERLWQMSSRTRFACGCLRPTTALFREAALGNDLNDIRNPLGPNKVDVDQMVPSRCCPKGLGGLQITVEFNYPLDLAAGHNQLGCDLTLTVISVEVSE